MRIANDPRNLMTVNKGQCLSRFHIMGKELNSDTGFVFSSIFFERSFLEIFRIGGTSQVIFMGLSRILLLSMLGSLICLVLLTHNLKKDQALSR